MKVDYKNLTIEEKFSLWNIGKDYRLNTCDGKFTRCRMSDGPIGTKVAKETFVGAGIVQATGEFAPAVCHASHSVLANSWNKELCYEVGKYIADEAVERDVNLLFAPSVNLKRSPLCGRNFEYFSEDPYHAGLLAKAYVEGVQSKGIAACPKHFLANNREYHRFGQSSEIDERTLREIYLKVFEIVFEAKPLALMSAYNLVNGKFVHENRRLLTKILRDELGFDGIVVSDGGAVKDIFKAFKGGLNVLEPRIEGAEQRLLEAYQEGKLSEEDVEIAIKPIVKFLGEIEEEKKKYRVEYTEEQRRLHTIKEAREGIILLKNDGILPLKDGTEIAVLGMGSDTCFIGGGSARLDPSARVYSIDKCLRKALPNSKIVEHPAYQIQIADYVMHILDCALQIAYGKDYCIINICELPERVGENQDRTSMRLHPILEMLIEETAKVNPNVIVNIYAGGVIDMSMWIDKVRAVVFVGFAGEGQNEALAEVLSGKVCPSGKTSETFPCSQNDVPVSVMKIKGNVDVYEERQFFGYRYYDANDKKVLFPFGFGLSYAKFRYEDFRITEQTEKGYVIEGGIYNDSDIDGKEVVQLYVRDVSSYLSRPVRELRKFEKIFVKARCKATVCFEILKRDLACFSTADNAWIVEDGWYELQIGASSRDIKFVLPIKIGEAPVYY